MAIDMKKIPTILAILFFLFFSAGCIAAPSGVTLIGHFSNQIVSGDDDPHIVGGYWISLFQQDKTLFGNIGVATGSLEPAQGRLYDIAFDPATKKLSFKAKYSTGIEGGKGIPADRESRKLLLFSGTLGRKSLKGIVIVKDGYNLAHRGTKTFETMKRVKLDYKPESLEKWAELTYLDMHW
jgi:hypothetical protein